LPPVFEVLSAASGGEPRGADELIKRAEDVL